MKTEQKPSESSKRDGAGRKAPEGPGDSPAPPQAEGAGRPGSACPPLCKKNWWFDLPVRETIHTDTGESFYSDFVFRVPVHFVAPVSENTALETAAHKCEMFCKRHSLTRLISAH